MQGQPRMRVSTAAVGAVGVVVHAVMANVGVGVGIMAVAVVVSGGGGGGGDVVRRFGRGGRRGRNERRTQCRCSGRTVSRP